MVLWWLKDYSLYVQRRGTLERHPNSQDHATTLSRYFLTNFSEDLLPDGLVSLAGGGGGGEEEHSEPGPVRPHFTPALGSSVI